MARVCPWRWGRARHSKSMTAILGGGVEWMFERKVQNSHKGPTEKEPVKLENGERDERRAMESTSAQGEKSFEEF